jgi:F-type H+-transporting ATPase subunit b
MPIPYRLALAAGGESHPLIDIDSTAAIGLVLFLVTLFLLSRLLFKPYLEVRDARSAGIEGAQAEALRMREQASGAGADYDAKFERARNRASDERAKLRQEALEAERQVTTAARNDMQSAVTSARETLAREKADAEQRLTAQTGVLAQQIASRLLGRELR